MLELQLAAIAFLVLHLLFAAAPLPSWRGMPRGERGRRLLGLGAELPALAWLIAAYRRAPELALWEPPDALLALALVLPLPAALLLVAGLAALDPPLSGRREESAGAEAVRGIVRVTRHPLSWAVSLWALGHLLAADDLAALWLFAALFAAFTLGPALVDRRRLREGGPGVGIFYQTTSNLPFQAILEGRQRLAFREIGPAPIAGALALYLVLVLLHGPLLGVPLLSEG